MKTTNCKITVEGTNTDGRPFTLTTRGSVVIREKETAQDYFFDDRSLPKADKYELIADLDYDYSTGSVFRYELNKMLVTKTLTVAYDGYVELSRMKKTLGVPPEATAQFPEGVAEVVFTWEEVV